MKIDSKVHGDRHHAFGACSMSLMWCYRGGGDFVQEEDGPSPEYIIENSIIPQIHNRYRDQGTKALYEPEGPGL